MFLRYIWITTYLTYHRRFIYGLEEVEIIYPNFGKTARHLSSSINISFSKLHRTHNFYIRISAHKSPSIFLDDLIGNEDFDDYKDKNEHMYEGIVEVVSMVNKDGTVLSSLYPIVLEIYSSHIYATFGDEMANFVIEPATNLTNRFSNPHRFIFAPKVNETYRPLQGLNMNASLLIYNTPQHMNRRDGERIKYIIETTLHIPPNKINTPERYILHIIAQTNHILSFIDPYIDLRIKVANLYTYPDDMVYDNNIYKTMIEFCNYKKTYVNYIDLTILITNKASQNINNSIVSGLAGLNFMCVPSVSAIVVQDQGFSTGQLIAHEIGHLLGSDHDNNGPCHNASYRGILHSNSRLNERYRWSPCSINKIKKFLQLPLADCLTTQTTIGPTNLDSLKFPGYYITNRQCQIDLHLKRSVIAYKASDCSRIYCKVNNTIRMLSNPPLEGAPCLVSSRNRTMLTRIKYGKVCYKVGMIGAVGHPVQKLDFKSAQDRVIYQSFKTASEIFARLEDALEKFNNDIA